MVNPYIDSCCKWKSISPHHRVNKIRSELVDQIQRVVGRCTGRLGFFLQTVQLLLLSHIGKALHMSMSTFSKLRIFEQVSVWFLNKLNHLSLKAKSHCLRSVKKVFGGKFQQRWFWAKVSLSKSDFEEKQVPTKWFWAKVNFSKVILSESKILEKWFWGRATFNKVICAKALLASWKNC